ncbi:MAG: hypothetical protein AAF721_25810 [Myxococcota bacterium]
MACSSVRLDGQSLWARRVRCLRFGAALVCLTGLGCASGGTPDQGSTFGDPTVPMMTVGSPMEAGMDSDGTSATGSDPATDGDDEGVATSETGDDGGGSEVDDGAADGPQPDNGMYSDCLTTAECVGVNTCVTIFDNAGAPFDGFCTLDNCSDPLADCDPSPGGDVVASCVEITLNGEPASACALNCAGGKTCPSGMTCYEDDGIPVCA